MFQMELLCATIIKLNRLKKIKMADEMVSGTIFRHEVDF